MDFAVADEIARLAVEQHKRDMERIESIYRMDKKKAQRILSRVPATVAEDIMAQASLTDDEKDVVRLCVRRELSLEDAEEELHISAKTVQRTKKEAMEKLLLHFNYLSMVFRAVNEGA